MSADTDLFHATVAALEPWWDAPAWVLAYSGGLDSAVLLYLLQRATAAGAPPLRALHIDHGLQAGSGDWAEHCARECAALGVPLEVVTVAVEPGGAGLEAAAREARYRVFEESLAPGECLLMAHHLDDQIETFFLRLMRGAGLDGLAAMPSYRTLGAGHLLRPLLGLERVALECYARDHGLEWIEDPSNADTRLDRNYLRGEVLPRLAERWPSYRRNVGRSIQWLDHARVALGEQHNEAEECRGAMGDPGIALAPLRAMDPGQCMLHIRAWLKALGLAMPDAAVLQEFVRQLQEAGRDASPRLDSGRYRLGCYRDGLYRLPMGEDPEGEYALSVGQSIEIPGVGRLSLVPAEESGFGLMAGETLRIAFAGEGLRLRPAGRGGTKSLKKLAQEASIPPWWRSRLPLVYAGEELLAVADLWLCDSSRLIQTGNGAEPRYRLAWERNTPAP